MHPANNESTPIKSAKLICFLKVIILKPPAQLGTWYIKLLQSLAAARIVLPARARYYSNCIRYGTAS
jgi:hypothetical protein